MASIYFTEFLEFLTHDLSLTKDYIPDENGFELDISYNNNEGRYSFYLKNLNGMYVSLNTKSRKFLDKTKENVSEYEFPLELTAERLTRFYMVNAHYLVTDYNGFRLALTSHEMAENAYFTSFAETSDQHISIVSDFALEIPIEKSHMDIKIKKCTIPKAPVEGGMIQCHDVGIMTSPYREVCLGGDDCETSSSESGSESEEEYEVRGQCTAFDDELEEELIEEIVKEIFYPLYIAASGNIQKDDYEPVSTYSSPIPPEMQEDVTPNKYISLLSNPDENVIPANAEVSQPEVSSYEVFVPPAPVVQEPYLVNPYENVVPAEEQNALALIPVEEQNALALIPVEEQNALLPAPVIVQTQDVENVKIIVESVAIKYFDKLRVTDFISELKNELGPYAEKDIANLKNLYNGIFKSIEDAKLDVAEMDNLLQIFNVADDFISNIVQDLRTQGITLPSVSNDACMSDFLTRQFETLRMTDTDKDSLETLYAYYTDTLLQPTCFQSKKRTNLQLSEFEHFSRYIHTLNTYMAKLSNERFDLYKKFLSREEYEGYYRDVFGSRKNLEDWNFTREFDRRGEEIRKNRDYECTSGWSGFAYESPECDDAEKELQKYEDDLGKLIQQDSCYYEKAGVENDCDTIAPEEYRGKRYLHRDKENNVTTQGYAGNVSAKKRAFNEATKNFTYEGKSISELGWSWNDYNTHLLSTIALIDKLMEKISDRMKIDQKVYMKMYLA